jgi:serine/threonine protein kinase
LGTPEYWSPEQASGQPVDPRSDVYSLGVLLYEMLLGQAPFSGHSYTDVIAQHMNVEITAIADPPGREPIPASLKSIVLNCLLKDPAQRFRSANELGQALRNLCLLPSESSRRLVRADPQVEPQHNFSVGWLAGLVLLASGVWLVSRVWSASDQVSIAVQLADQVTIRVTSDPPGAQIFAAGGDTVLGVTPADLQVPRTRETLTLLIRFTEGKSVAMKVVPTRNARVHAEFAGATNKGP